MKLTIDNLDGLGAQDYTAALATDQPLQLERRFNLPSICTMVLDCAAHNLETPARRGRVVMMAENGTVMFTGYIAAAAAPMYAGAGIAGAYYRWEVNAISDEMLLDKLPVPWGGAGYGESAAQILETLTTRVRSGTIATGGVTLATTVGTFLTEAAESWSANAGALASSVYAAYRVQSGALQVQPVGTVTHSVAAGNGNWKLDPLKTTQAKELANDITVTGAVEPTAYACDMLYGDGGTTLFNLTEAPMMIGKSKGLLINESFNEATFDAQTWEVSDPGSHLSITSAGLTMNGGNGYDGQTTLTAIDLVEMGGNVVLEVGNVQLNSGSNGVLCGLYAGTTNIANCFAGYRVRQSGGATIVVPLVWGSEVGTPFTITAGHSYTLRVRAYCSELQRVMQTYYAMNGGSLEQFGGGFISAPMNLVFDLQDLGNASNTPATVLYDGNVSSSPATCTFVATDCINILGSMGFCRVSRSGTAWVTSQPPTGAAYTRLIGLAGEGTDCKIESTGKISFYAGRVPVAGEVVSVFYRVPARSRARLASTTSIASEGSDGLPGVARWLGKIEQPLTRSSADCENAAAAMLVFSTNPTATWSGNYTGVNLQMGADVWPGDVLSLPQPSGAALDVIVRTVKIICRANGPEVMEYTVAFANDWAEGLSLKLSESISTDVILPQSVESVPGSVLSNLQQLQVSSISTTAIGINAGVAPPSGGGFEVRRRDWDFGAGVDQDLVLRSPVQNFTIPRAAQVEQYFIRMYDGSNPPVYSRFSSAVFTNVPV